MLKPLIALSVFAASILPLSPVLADLPTSQQVEPCLDSQAYRQVESATVYQQVGSLFAIELDLNARGIKYKAMQVIELGRDDKCVSLFNDSYFAQPLSTFFDIETAKQLRLGWERRRINSDRPFDKTQDWLSKNKISLAPESRWAFEQLNLDLSKTTSCESSTLGKFCY